jgi:hypothetical protein
MSKTIKDLRTTIAQMDALFPALADKPSKQADLLIEKSSAQKNLSSLEADERKIEQHTRINELEANHEADAKRIAELEREIAALQVRPLPEAIKVPDPEHEGVRRDNARLNDMFKAIAGSFRTEHERAQMAIRVITYCSQETAKVFVPLLGFSYREYAQNSLSYKTDADLRRVIRVAECEGPLTVFARAALAFRESECQTVTEPARDKGFIPDTRSGAEKLREAQEIGHKLRRSQVRPSRVEIVTRDAEENLRTQPKSIVGTPDAMPHRERITPVYVGSLSSTPKEISGGNDFSSWVK